MPTYSHGPRLLKGAIVVVSDSNSQPQTIAFQYNPETVRRSLQAQTAGGEGDQGNRSQIVRFVGAPVETIELEVYMDVIDQMERNDGQAIQNGIYPQLALLELLAYPTSQQVIQNDTLLASGVLEVAPLAAPLALFVWGAKRVLPVRLTSLTITEETFEPNLNPIRATISLSMRALSYSDLLPGTKGYNLFMAYQQTKESLAALGLTGSAGSPLGVDTSRF